MPLRSAEEPRLVSPIRFLVLPHVCEPLTGYSGWKMGYISGFLRGQAPVHCLRLRRTPLAKHGGAAWWGRALPRTGVVWHRHICIRYAALLHCLHGEEGLGGAHSSAESLSRTLCDTIGSEVEIFRSGIQSPNNPTLQYFFFYHYCLGPRSTTSSPPVCKALSRLGLSAYRAMRMQRATRSQ